MTRAGWVGAALATGLLLLASAAGYRALVRGVEPAAAGVATNFSSVLAASRQERAGESSQGFLYGRITTVEGVTYEGRLRWGGDQEAFWDDAFNGFKQENRWRVHLPPERLTVRRPITIFGVEVASRERPVDLSRPFLARFGDLARIEAEGRDVRVTLKSGTVVTLDRFDASDFDDGVRVWDGERGVVDLDSLRIRAIEFLPTAELDTAPSRLHGTVRTRQGEFTGFVQWSREASVGTDELAGRAADGERSLRFESVRSIAHRSPDSAVVTLVDGREIGLAGRAAVGRGHRGIVVGDRRYGRVLVSWEAFERVDFDDPGARSGGPAYDDFAPGRPLTGSVTTRSGRRLAGRLVYDLDESETTETLDAPSGGLDYTIPFDRVASIVLPSDAGRGERRARLTLWSGEELRLELAGDLGERNAGLLVFADGRERPELVPWVEVDRIDFDPPPGRAAALGAAAAAPTSLDRHCAALAASARPGMEELLTRLAAEDEDVSSLAADDLSCRGEEARPAVPAMIRLFASDAGETQANAIGAVARLGVIAVPALVEALDDRDTRVRDNACRALGRIGAAARPALVALAERRGRDGYDPALIDLTIELIESP